MAVTCTCTCCSFTVVTGRWGGGGGGVGPVVRALQYSGLIKRFGFRPCWGGYVVFLGRILYLLLQCLTLSRCILKWVPSYLMLRVMLFVKGGIQKLVYASA